MKPGSLSGFLSVSLKKTARDLKVLPDQVDYLQELRKQVASSISLEERSDETENVRWDSELELR